MPKQKKVRLTKLARDLQSPYSTVGAAVASLSLAGSEENSHDADSNNGDKDKQRRCLSKHSSGASFVEKLLQVRQQMEEQKDLSVDIAKLEEYRKLSRGQRKRRDKKEKWQRKHQFIQYGEKIIKEISDNKKVRIFIRL